MGKSKPRGCFQHRKDDTYTVKPLHDHHAPKFNHNHNHNHHDDDHTHTHTHGNDYVDDEVVVVEGEYSEPSSSSSYNKPLKGKNKRWVSKNRDEKVKIQVEEGGGVKGKEGVVVAVERGGDDEVVVGEVEVVEEEGKVGGGDLVRKLEELEIGVEEVELCEEDVKVNDQLQEDELLAMESIYGDNVYALEKRHGLRSFQFHIDIELSSEYTVSTNLKMPPQSSSQVDISDEFSYTFNVQYLPPIVLTCLLPKSYPSHSPPKFTISVQWLHESRISKLCSMLDSMWNEQPGQEILYHWADWLHSSTLPYLGFEKELVLAYVMESSSDRRAISGRVSPDVDIPSLKSYNEMRQHENFLNGFHQCYICFSEYAGTEFLRMPCHHFFCVKCMKTYANVHVKEGTVNKLECPYTKCNRMIPPCLLKRLLGDEEFERWEALMLQKTLDAMSDVAYCPRCETACLEDEEQHAQCSKCFFSFCTLCRERRHVGTECLTAEMKIRVLEERQGSSNLQYAQRKKEQELIMELRSVAEILRDAKQCPSCKIAISRTEGCNKMVCSNCGGYFCYRCNKKIDGYDHFRAGACELFPQEMINEWEVNQLNNRQLVGQYLALNHAGNVKSCPTCRQLNPKIGNNNHMFCWSCQTNYCYQCGQIVRRGSQHYGANRCKQHSAD